MRRVLVIRFSALGDVIQTFPSLYHLLSIGSEVHFLTKQSFSELVTCVDSTLTVHTIPDHASFTELVAKVKELRLLNFDYVFDLHRNLRSLVVTALLRVNSSRISKYRLREMLLFFFRRKAFLQIFGKPIDRVAEGLRVVKMGGREVRRRSETIGMTLPMVPIEVQQWIRRQNHGFVCIAGESAWMTKEWPIGRFIDLAQCISTMGFGVMWLGLRKLPREAAIPGSIDLTRCLSISQVATVLREARLLVCNDSGLMHVAESVGTRVVALFGPTSREVGFAPRLPKSQIVEADLWCRPCSKTGRWCIRPFARRKCLNDIGVDVVLEAVKKSLQGHQ